MRKKIVIEVLPAPHPFLSFQKYIRYLFVLLEEARKIRRKIR